MASKGTVAAYRRQQGSCLWQLVLDSGRGGDELPRKSVFSYLSHQVQNSIPPSPAVIMTALSDARSVAIALSVAIARSLALSIAAARSVAIIQLFVSAF